MLVSVVVGIAVLVAIGNSVKQCGLPGEGGCPVSPQAQASIDAAAEKARLAALGGPPPGNCGSQPVPVHAEVPGTIWDSAASAGGYAQGIAIGKEPVWLQTGAMQLENGKAVLHLPNDQRSRTADGYPIHPWWITDAAFTGTINVRLVDNGTGQEAKSVPASHQRDAGVLDPSEAKAITNGDTPPYRLFATTTYLQSPGCYVAEAKWSGGEWAIAFAVGQ